MSHGLNSGLEQKNDRSCTTKLCSRRMQYTCCSNSTESPCSAHSPDMFLLHYEIKQGLPIEYMYTFAASIARPATNLIVTQTSEKLQPTGSTRIRMHPRLRDCKHSCLRSVRAPLNQCTPECVDCCQLDVLGPKNFFMAWKSCFSSKGFETYPSIPCFVHSS